MKQPNRTQSNPQGESGGPSWTDPFPGRQTATADKSPGKRAEPPREALSINDRPRAAGTSELSAGAGAQRDSKSHPEDAELLRAVKRFEGERNRLEASVERRFGAKTRPWWRVSRVGSRDESEVSPGAVVEANVNPLVADALQTQNWLSGFPERTVYSRCTQANNYVMLARDLQNRLNADEVARCTENPLEHLLLALEHSPCAAEALRVSLTMFYAATTAVGLRVRAADFPTAAPGAPSPPGGQSASPQPSAKHKLDVAMLTLTAHRIVVRYTGKRARANPSEGERDTVADLQRWLEQQVYQPLGIPARRDLVLELVLIGDETCVALRNPAHRVPLSTALIELLYVAASVDEMVEFAARYGGPKYREWLRLRCAATARVLLAPGRVARVTETLRAVDPVKQLGSVVRVTSLPLAFVFGDEFSWKAVAGLLFNARYRDFVENLAYTLSAQRAGFSNEQVSAFYDNVLTRDEVVVNDSVLRNLGRIFDPESVKEADVAQDKLSDAEKCLDPLIKNMPCPFEPDPGFDDTFSLARFIESTRLSRLITPSFVRSTFRALRSLRSTSLLAKAVDRVMQVVHERDTSEASVKVLPELASMYLSFGEGSENDQQSSEAPSPLVSKLRNLSPKQLKDAQEAVSDYVRLFFELSSLPRRNPNSAVVPLSKLARSDSAPAWYQYWMLHDENYVQDNIEDNAALEKQISLIPVSTWSIPYKNNPLLAYLEGKPFNTGVEGHAVLLVLDPELRTVTLVDTNAHYATHHAWVYAKACFVQAASQKAQKERSSSQKGKQEPEGVASYQGWDVPVVAQNALGTQVGIGSNATQEMFVTNVLIPNVLGASIARRLGWRFVSGSALSLDSLHYTNEFLQRTRVPAEGSAAPSKQSAIFNKSGECSNFSFAFSVLTAATSGSAIVPPQTLYLLSLPTSFNDAALIRALLFAYGTKNPQMIAQLNKCLLSATEYVKSNPRVFSPPSPNRRSELASMSALIETFQLFDPCA